MNFVFFGTPDFAAITLDELSAQGLLPSLIVTAPDKPKGRKLLMTASPVRLWGEMHQIPVITPESLDDATYKMLADAGADLFVVSAYGKLIPKRFLDLPKHGALNVHPSLLPKFRGASPVESAILSLKSETGVTIMLLDEEMDHGPILAQQKVPVSSWPPKGTMLTRILAVAGGTLLAKTIPCWIGGELLPVPQDHTQATYTKKISKEDGLIDLAHDAEVNLKKVRAFDEWPGAYMFVERGETRLRVKITDAEVSNGTFVITRVIPEGKREMDYEDFLRGNAGARPG